MKILERGLAYDSTGKPPAERIACFPGLCRTASGTLLTVFQIGAAKNAATSTLGICRSRDAGRTWQKLKTAFDTSLNGVAGSLGAGEMIEVRPGRLFLLVSWVDRSDRNRPMFDPATEGILHTKLLKTFSSDEGETWTPWEEIRWAGLDYSPHGSGPMLQWPDGSFAISFESHQAFDDQDPAKRNAQGAWLLISRDFGRSFEPPVLVAEDPTRRLFYWDQRICAGAGPGEFYALFWTHDREQGKDITVHLRRGRVTPNGDLLGPILDTGFPGQVATARLLPDGRLWVMAVDRNFPGQISLWESKDQGGSWTGLEPLYVHDGSARSAYGGSRITTADVWDSLAKWCFGYPALAILGRHEALLTYYAGVPQNLNIHWARIGLD